MVDAPLVVNEETIMTGVGRAAMISDRAVSPSIPGMLMSRETTSGWKART